MRQTSNSALKLHAELLAEQSLTRIEARVGEFDSRVRFRMLDRIESSWVDYLRDNQRKLRNDY
jgi:hypothetical protein